MNKPKAAAAAVRHALLFGALPVATLAPLLAHADEPATQMETITVTAQALKVDVPAEETPKSVSFVTEDDLRIRAPQKVDEALRYTSGVTAQPFGNDNDTDWYRVRGFEAATYLNGNRLYRDGFYTWLIEPYGLERIEVVKGPSAILFGESAPGGVVNAVQKKPTYTPQGEVKVEAGSNNHQAVAFDISDQATDDGSVRYRLVGLMKSEDGELDQTYNERFYVAPSVEIDISDRTMLTVMGTYLRDDGVPTNPFMPIVGTVAESPNGKIDPSTNLGEPDYDTYEREQISLGYQLDHELNDVWQLSQQFNYGYNDLKLISTYIFPTDFDGDGLYDRGMTYRDGTNQSVSLDNNGVGTWYSDLAEHTLLVGVDLQYHYTDGDEETGFGFGFADPINPWAPEYGNYRPLDDASIVDRKIRKSQASVYSQYQIKYDSRWIGVIGGRYDYFAVDNKSQQANEHETLNEGQFSFNAGAMYLADMGLSPYVSYSQSFEVLSTIDLTTKKLYEPRESEQVEVGVKYTPDFFDGYANLAYFDITNKNALSSATDEQGAPVQTQTGESTSKGVELEVVGQITDSVDISAAYTYTDAEINPKNGSGSLQAHLIPKHQATAWVNYDAGYAGVEGLRLGTGVRYVGETVSDQQFSSPKVTVDSATLWDISASYDINKQWQAQLNVNNVLDEEYVAGCDTYCYYGQSRSVMLNANYRW